MTRIFIEEYDLIRIACENRVSRSFKAIFALLAVIVLCLAIAWRWGI